VNVPEYAQYGTGPLETFQVSLYPDGTVQFSYNGVTVSSAVTGIEVKEDRLMLQRRGDYIMIGGKFPRLTKKEAKARLKEIKRVLLAV